MDKKLDYTPICMNNFDRNSPCRKYLFCLCFLFSCWPGRISELQFKHSILHILWCILSTQDVHRFCSIAISDFLIENSRLLLNVYSLQNSCAAALHKISTSQFPAAGKCSSHSQGDGNMPLGVSQRKIYPVPSNSVELCMISENTALGQSHSVSIMQSSYFCLEWQSVAV